MRESTILASPLPPLLPLLLRFELLLLLLFCSSPALNPALVLILEEGDASAVLVCALPVTPPPPSTGCSSMACRRSGGTKHSRRVAHFTSSAPSRGACRIARWTLYGRIYRHKLTKRTSDRILDAHEDQENIVIHL